jgi:hypothetical protein
MDFNYYLDLLRYNIFVQLGIGFVIVVLCVCNIRMCYINIKRCHAQSGPTHAQGTCPDPRTHAQGIRTIVPDPRTGPTKARATFYPEKDEEPDSPVYTHTDCPNYNKTPCKIYINDKGNRISHI